MKKTTAIMLAVSMSFCMSANVLASEADASIEDNGVITSTGTDISGQEEVGNSILDTEDDEGGTKAEEDEELIQEDSSVKASDINENSSEDILLPEIDVTEEGNVDLDAISPWLSDYDYSVSEDTVILEAYNGHETAITVPGSAIINGTEYQKIQITAGVWPYAVSLSFENGVVFPDNCKDLFFKMRQLKEIDVSHVDTSNVTVMRNMFSDCINLTALDLSSLDTSSVTDMSNMFNYSCNLCSLNLSGFDTSNVTDMSNMFSYCSSLTSLDVTCFNTGNVENMSGMFYYCNRLSSLDVSSFDTSHVTDMSSMFMDCASLTSLDVTCFDTSNVIDMSCMFSGLQMSSFDANSFDTDNATDMSSMFANCSNLNSLDLSSFNTINVTNMSSMFRNCNSLSSLDISSFETGNVTNMSNMFYSCESLRSLDVSGFDTGNVRSMSNMFNCCVNLDSLDIGSFDTGNVTDMSYLFGDCSSLSSLDVSSFDTSSVTDMSHMFYNCEYLSSLDVSGFDTGSVTEMFSMFEYCSSLSTIDVSGFDTRNVTDISFMFGHCTDLLSLNINGFDTSNLAEMRGMFESCRNMVRLDLSMLDLSLVNDADGALEDCISLKTIQVPVGLEVDIALPFAFVSAGEDDGNLYTYLPCNLAESTTLTRAECSDWLKDYTYTVSSDTIELISYIGQTLDILVPGSGTVGDVMYDKVRLESDVWRDVREIIESVSFGTGVIFPDYCGSIFYGFSNCRQFDLNGVDTSNVYDMQGMFYDCSSLKSLNLSSFDTSSVIGMDGMFSGCSSLESLDLSSFDTSNVERMDAMFYDCSSLKSLNLCSFDTSGVDGMCCMFYNCNSLKSLDLSSFDISNVITTEEMFYNCTSLSDLDLSGFNTSSVKDVDCMFSNCSSLLALDLRGFDFSNAYSYDQMLNGCRDLLAINAPAGLSYDIALPAVYAGSDGNIYTSLPKDKEDSITLIWTDILDNSSENVIRSSDYSIEIYSGPDSVDIPADTEITFRVEAESAFGEELSYQWQYTGASGTSWHNFTGGTGDTLTKKIRESWNGWKVRCLVMDKRGVTLNSKIAKITILVEAITISGHPVDVEAQAGSYVGFSVAAESFDKSPLTYQWQYQGASSSTWHNLSNATNSIVFKTLQKSWNGWRIRCLVTDQYGHTVASDSAAISIMPDLILVMKQPVFDEVPADTEVTFSVTAESSVGEELSYQWQYQGTSGARWNSFIGGNAPYLTKTVKSSWNGWKVRCVITDVSGHSVMSDSVIVSIMTDPVLITAQPVPVLSAPGKNVTFTVGAESRLGMALSYQWQYQGVSGTKWNNFANATNASMTKIIQSSWNGWKVRCLITDEKGHSGTSNTALITVIEDPIRITGHPVSISTLAKKNVTFSVGAESALGEVLSYQWQYQGVSGAKWNNFDGAVNPFMTKTVQSSWNGWKVRCLVTDISGNSEVSDTAVITILENPIHIITQPISVTAFAGKSVTFIVEAESAAGENLSYQWQYQGTSGTKWYNFANAANASMTKTVQSSWNGWKVRCLVSDGNGNSAFSETAVVTAE